MALVLPQIFDPPQATPPKSGLIAVADAFDRLHEHDTHDHWEFGGYAYRPEGVGKGVGRAMSVLDYTNAGSDVDRAAHEDIKSDDQGTDRLISAYPFLLETEETCSAVGFNEGNYEQRARRALEKLQSKILEWEFWTGEVAQLDSLDPAVYQWLTQAHANAAGSVPEHGAFDLTPVAGAVDPRHAMALLEQALSESGNGTGFIHVTKQIALLTSDRWTEGPLITWPDSGVVVGAGYPGTSPAGAAPAAGESWVYGTDPVDVHLGPVEVVPPTLGEALDKAKNTVSFRAQRTAAVSWDGFAHYAIRATI